MLELRENKFENDLVRKYLYENKIVALQALELVSDHFEIVFKEGANLENINLDTDIIVRMKDSIKNTFIANNIIKDCKNEITVGDVFPENLSGIFNNARNYFGCDFVDDYESDSYYDNEVLICYILRSIYLNKFRDIKTLADIKEPIPTQIFIEIFNKEMKENKEPIEFYTETPDGIIAGNLVQIEQKNTMMGSFLQLFMECITKCSRSGYATVNIILNRDMPALMQSIDDINIVKLTPEIKATLIERGKKYVDCSQKPLYYAYDGFGYTPGYGGDRKLNCTGRLMIDLKAMQKLAPHIGNSWYTGSPMQKPEFEEIPSNDLWRTMPCLFGFSFTSKKWCRFSVDGLKPIVFAENAFEELIIPQIYKDIFLASLTQDMPSFDNIEGKGDAKIFLLYGPAGVGKTLTAESVAEYLKKPLYFVSVGELGTDPDSMESALTEIMEVAATWDSLVLLDEVDVFAIKRNGADLQRNAMTAILLRLLEKYEGILFMTTNLIDNLDPAFLSRATARIPYEALTNEAKEKIWRNILTKAQDAGAVIDPAIENSLKSIASIDTNGREIKNQVRLAYAMAMMREDKTITIDTLTQLTAINRQK